MLWLAAGVVLLALLWWCGRTIGILSGGAANRMRRIQELGLESKFEELDRLVKTGAMPWHEAKRAQRLALRLAEYEDEIRTMRIPPEHVALFEPDANDGGVEQEALEILLARGVLARAPNGKDFVFRKPAA